jgi:hypothetical protein
LAGRVPDLKALGELVSLLLPAASDVDPHVPRERQ